MSFPWAKYSNTGQYFARDLQTVRWGSIKVRRDLSYKVRRDLSIKVRRDLSKKFRRDLSYKVRRD